MIFAATEGVWGRGALQHLIRLIFASGLMIGIAMVDVKVWYALAYPAYIGALVLLVSVDILGVTINGSQRWLDIGGMRLQPSEVMKPAVVLAMARYYHDLPKRHVSSLMGLLGAAMFIDPSRDPTGASYHITQSKIALGSGGVSGKGFMNGTQRQLEYVPENRTDFIFTVIGEEFGLVGSLLTMGLYIAVISLCLWLSVQCKHIFSRLLILGLTTTFTLYIFINLAMVMGLAPVVGVPLPLISYGGTVILTVMAGFALVLSAHLHRQNELPRSQF